MTSLVMCLLINVNNLAETEKNVVFLTVYSDTINIGHCNLKYRVFLAYISDSSNMLHFHFWRVNIYDFPVEKKRH